MDFLEQVGVFTIVCIGILAVFFWIVATSFWAGTVELQTKCERENNVHQCEMKFVPVAHGEIK